ncbi:MAG: hypothetical protein JWP89_5932 [Schlesneria sp.]|nr:hypothetical protein [Schlesneria sp.]
MNRRDGRGQSMLKSHSESAHYWTHSCEVRVDLLGAKFGHLNLELVQSVRMLTESHPLEVNVGRTLASD